VGSVTIDGVGNVVTTGETSTGAVGTVTLKADADVSVEVNEVFPQGYGTGRVGTVIAGISVEFVTTGLASGTNVGNVTVQANADAIVTGVQATGERGNVKVFDQVIPDQIPSFQPPVPGLQPGDPLSSPAYKAPQGAPGGFVPGDRLQAPTWKDVA
jgi:hypothetical protein